MLITRSTTQAQNCPTIYLSSEVIEPVKVFKYLGVWLTDDLTWSKHVERVCCRSRRLPRTINFMHVHTVAPSFPCVWLKLAWSTRLALSTSSDTNYIQACVARLAMWTRQKWSSAHVHYWPVSRPWQIMVNFLLIFLFLYCPIFYLFFFQILPIFFSMYLFFSNILAKKLIFMTKLKINYDFQWSYATWPMDIVLQRGLLLGSEGIA